MFLLHNLIIMFVFLSHVPPGLAGTNGQYVALLVVVELDSAGGFA